MTSIMLKNATGKEALLYRKAAAYYGGLCAEKYRLFSRGEPSLWEIGCILTSLPAKMRAWMPSVCFPAKLL